MPNSLNIVKVTGHYTADPAIAKKWLKRVEESGEFACDFEAKVRYTPEQIAALEQLANNEKLPNLERRKAQAVLDATALNHPVHSMVTHFSFGTADDEAYVIVTETDELRAMVFDFLTTTEATQIWHNASYDFMHIYFHTRKFPKVYEDTAIFTKTLINHVESHKAQVGLKELAGHRYGHWALAKEDFDMPDLWDNTLLLYAATDAAATWYVWESLCRNTLGQLKRIPKTNEEYSPWDQLADAPSPINAHYEPSHFYHHTAKWLIRGTVRMMLTGVPMSMTRVEDLEGTLERIIASVHTGIANNPTVKAFLEKRHEEDVEKYIADMKSRMRGPDHYLKDFDASKAIDRSYFMDIFARRVGMQMPSEKYPSGVSKWPAALVKRLAAVHLPLKALADKSLSAKNATAVEAAWAMAKDKAEAFNKRYVDAINNPQLEQRSFNPGSTTQKREIFDWLAIPSEAVSPTTGEASWNKEQIERVHYESDDEDIVAFTKLLLEYSESAIVRNNFIQAFYRYTVDGVLYGVYRLLGAKSGRYTSQSPNMLNMPASASAFAKPVKRCFVAPKGYVVATADFAALEDRVVANLSEDENKLSIFLEGIDGHSLATVFYWPLETAKVLETEYDDIKEKAKAFKALVDAKNAEADTLRSNSKKISFGLAYGCFPPKVAASAKIPLPEAEKIFNAYHEEMFPGITRYRENYVLEAAKRQGYIHLGLGFRIYSDQPDRDIRTLNNGTCQFWSMLSVLSVDKMYQLIDKAGYSKDIFITSSIYDSIYFICRDDPAIIKWLNDNLIPTMTQDFMKGQILKNSAEMEIGLDWDALHAVPNGASLDQIKEIRKEF